MPAGLLAAGFGAVKVRREFFRGVRCAGFRGRVASLAKATPRVYASAPMFLLTPRYLKFGREFIKDAKKVLAYKRDLLSAQTIAEFEAGIARLEAAVKARDKAAVEEAARALDAQCGSFSPATEHSSWRENCEVILVAIVVALGVRTYILQPFTIPTGSMQPTLNGIIGYKTQTEPPNIVSRIVGFAVKGRTWVNVVAKTDDVIVDIREVKSLPFMNVKVPFGMVSRTEIVGQRQSYIVDCPPDTLTRYLLEPMRPLKAGDVIARGYYDTGDHVFVDKMSYHFRKPAAGDVFVFNTQNIPTRENRQQLMRGPSQFYIKRLVGTPNDTLQIRPPELYVNGERGKPLGLQRVMSGENGYRGYSNASEQVGLYGQKTYQRMNLLGSPEETFMVEPKHYFAMGDNSFYSSDSRDWGMVPQENIMGRGFFVYWPFTAHFGLIR